MDPFRRLDERPVPPPWSSAVIYGSVNPAVFPRIPRTARRLLDVGCGDGTLGRAIKAEWPSHITGITHSEAEAAIARGRLDEVIAVDLNGYDPSGLASFDAIICSHVLEHLQAPAQLLRALRPHLAPGGSLLVALPNVLHWRQRMEFLRGRFRYTQGGLMDETHVRFFDWQTAAELVTGSGYELTERLADGTFPASRFMGPLGRALDRMATRALPGAFGWQFVLTAR